MAFPVVHLLAAQRAALGTPLAENGDYYLGAIAPDAVHLRGGIDTRSPDKVLSHLGVRGRRDGDGIPQAIAYWQATGDAPFDLGYGVHVLTDQAWVQFYPRAFPALMDDNDHTIPPVYRPDAALLDNWLCWQMLEPTDIIDLLSVAGAPAVHPYLTHAELIEWRDFYANKLRTTPRDSSAPPQIFDADKVLGFVEEIGAALHEVLVPYLK